MISVLEIEATNYWILPSCTKNKFNYFNVTFNIFFYKVITESVTVLKFYLLSLYVLFLLEITSYKIYNINNK